MKTSWIWVKLRLLLGFMLFWAFIDKLFGLGFTTTADKSWLAGNSPTYGYLKMGSYGPFASFYQNIAGSPITDWIFMLGLLLIGLALLLGIGLKIAGYSGALMMVLLYFSAFPPKNNPLIDEHLVYLVIFLGLANSDAGDMWGLGKWWKREPIVKKNPILK